MYGDPKIMNMLQRCPDCELLQSWYGSHYIKHHPLSHDIWILAYLITLSILCVVCKQICGHGQHKLDLLFRMPRVDTYQHMDHAL